MRVLVATLKTGSVGLNLQSASRVFFMDPWWNPAIEDQAIGRVHRIGQRREVEAVKFITVDSVEARIIKLAVHKKRVSDSIFDVDDVEAFSRSSKGRFELHYLLSLGESLPDPQQAEQ